MATKKKYSNIDLSKYDKGYQASQDVLNAQKLKQQAESAVSNYKDFNYSNQAGLDAAMDAITNRKKFSYDLNADALYQQYKDNYMAQGKQAMMDATGQAAALTGGYGNSYANTVGNQAYQGYLQQLNNVIPDLYNLALSTYQAEGDRLKDNYGILLDDKNTEYGMWADKRNQLVADRGYYADAYNNAYSQDYGMWNDNRSYDTSQYWNEYNAGYQADRDAVADAQWQKNYDESIRQYEANLAYQKGRDAVADKQWQKQFDEGVRQYNEQMAFNKAQAARSGSGGGSGGGNGSGNTTTKKVESSYKQTTGRNRFENNGKLFSESEYIGFRKTVSMHRGQEGRAQIIEDAVLEGKITGKQADELLAYYGISEEDFKKYRGIE